MNTEPEFAEEHTRALRIRIAVVGALIGATIIISYKTWLFPWLAEFVKSAPCRTVFDTKGLTVLWYGLFVGLPLQATLLIAAGFGWRGYKILRDGQFPPFKEKVYRPTKIQRGAKAKLIAYLHLSAILPILAITIWGGFQAAKISRATRPKVEACSADKLINRESQMRAIPSSRN